MKRGSPTRDSWLVTRGSHNPRDTSYELRAHEPRATNNACNGHVHHAPTSERGTGAWSAAPPPFRDNPRLILVGIGVLIAALVAILIVANRTPRFSPDFLSEFVLYALTAGDLTMLAGLVFVLARNIVKLIVERRQARAVRAFPRQARRACSWA